MGRETLPSGSSFVWKLLILQGVYCRGGPDVIVWVIPVEALLRLRGLSKCYTVLFVTLASTRCQSIVPIHGAVVLNKHVKNLCIWIGHLCGYFCNALK